MTPEQSTRLYEGLSSYQADQSPLDMSHSHSINTIASIRDYIISEDLLAGQRLNGKMSNVRRFFCLFVTFDFLFISLMWLICVMLDGQNLVKALTEQILHYHIQTSLFDIVLVAFLRFLVLIFFYAVLHINHWIIIALSTTLSCAFLIGKVFMFNWPKSSQPVFEVLLVLASFVISWGEAWFLDYRVIPQEANASRYLITATESERAPLIRNCVMGPSSTYTESVSNYYSPRTSPEGSIYTVDPSEPPSVRFTQTEESHYKQLAARTLQSAWDLYEKSDWQLKQQQGLDCAYIRKDPIFGSMFKLETEVNVAAKFLLEELYYKINNLAKWNTSVKESIKIQTLDEHTDITYQISENAARGLVSSRDFVNLRHWDQIENKYILSYVKCDHPKYPETKEYVRGENGVGGYIIETIPNHPNKCRFIWIINPNMKLKLPRSLVDREMIKMMFVYARELKTHLDREGEAN